MIGSLTGHVVFACSCTVAGEFMIAGVLLLDESFRPGIYELWDSSDTRYWLQLEGQPSSMAHNVPMRFVDAPI